MCFKLNRTSEDRTGSPPVQRADWRTFTCVFASEKFVATGEIANMNAHKSDFGRLRHIYSVYRYKYM